MQRLKDIDKLKEMKIVTKILSDLLYFFNENAVHKIEIPIQNIILERNHTAALALET